MKIHYGLSSSVAFAFVCFSAPLFAAEPTAEDKADAGQINTVCAQDAKTAGCCGEVMGKGLLRCLHEYKKTQHKGNDKAFAFSADCEAAIKHLREEKKSGK